MLPCPALLAIGVLYQIVRMLLWSLRSMNVYRLCMCPERASIAPLQVLWFERRVNLETSTRGLEESEREVS